MITRTSFCGGRATGPGSVRPVTRVPTSPGKAFAWRMIAASLLVALLQGCSGARRVDVANPLPLHHPADQVWLASQAELKSRAFGLDRIDRRHGIIETLPRTSSQWYEFWARDVVTAEDRAEASLHTIRRVVHLEMRAVAEDRCSLTCRANVERHVADAPAVSGSVRANAVFAGVAGRMPSLKGHPDTHAAQWVSLGRDTALEQDVLRSIAATILHRE